MRYIDRLEGSESPFCIRNGQKREVQCRELPEQNEVQKLLSPDMLPNYSLQKLTQVLMTARYGPAQHPLRCCALHSFTKAIMGTLDSAQGRQWIITDGIYAISLL